MKEITIEAEKRFPSTYEAQGGIRLDDPRHESKRKIFIEGANFAASLNRQGWEERVKELEKENAELKLECKKLAELFYGRNTF